jgi:hypothetical protein
VESHSVIDEHQRNIERDLERNGHSIKGHVGYDKFTPAAIATLIGAFCVHLVIGSQYAWGSISPYIAGYYRGLGFDTNMSEFYLVLPLIVITSTVVFPVGMHLSKEINSRFVIFTGGVIVVGSSLMASATLSTAMFFLFYAVGFGVGKGFLYPAPLYAGWTHLPGRKGFVSGIIVSGLGIGALMFGIIAQKLVNPENLTSTKVTVARDVEESYFPEEVNQRVPQMI